MIRPQKTSSPKQATVSMEKFRPNEKRLSNSFGPLMIFRTLTLFLDQPRVAVGQVFKGLISYDVDFKPKIRDR